MDHLYRRIHNKNRKLGAIEIKEQFNEKHGKVKVKVCDPLSFFPKKIKYLTLLVL